jgi:hypothetical protein
VVAGEVKHLAATIATGEIAATIATVERDGARPAMAASTGGIGQAATAGSRPPVPGTPPWSSWAPGPQRAPPRREHPYGHRKLPCTCWIRGGRAALHHAGPAHRSPGSLAGRRRRTRPRRRRAEVVADRSAATTAPGPRLPPRPCRATRAADRLPSRATMSGGLASQPCCHQFPRQDGRASGGPSACCREGLEHRNRSDLVLVEMLPQDAGWPGRLAVPDDLVRGDDEVNAVSRILR